MGKGTKRGALTALQQRGLERLEACGRAGVTIRAYARRRRLSEQRLYQVAKVLRRKGVLPPAMRGGRKGAPRVQAVRKPRFVEVEARAGAGASSAAAPSSRSLWCARLPNGVVLEGNADLVTAIAALAKL